MKRGYETPPPEEIENTGIRCFRIFIPDHPDFRQAFLGAYHNFTTWTVWKKTDDSRAKLAAELWREAEELTMNECPDIDLINIETALAGMMQIQSSMASSVANIADCVCQLATTAQNPPAPYPTIPEPPDTEEPPIFSEEPPANPQSVTDCQRNIWLSRVIQGKLIRIAEIMSASFPLNWVGIFQELKAAEGQATLIYRFTMLVIGAFAGVAVLVFSFLGWGVGSTLNAWAELFDDYIFSCKVFKNNVPADYDVFKTEINNMSSLSDLGKMFVKVLVWQEMLDDIFANTVYDEEGNPHTGLAHLMPNDCPACPEESGWKGTSVSCPDGLDYWSGDAARTYEDGVSCSTGNAIGVASGIYGSVISPHQAISMNFELAAGPYLFAYRAGSGSGYHLIELRNAATNAVAFSSTTFTRDGELHNVAITVPSTGLYNMRLTAARWIECYDWSWQVV